MSMQMGSMFQADNQKDKPAGQRPMGVGAMGGGMFPGGMRQPPFYRGGGGMGLREALGGRMDNFQAPQAKPAQPPMRSPQPMPSQPVPPPAPNRGVSGPMPPVQAPPSSTPQVDSPFPPTQQPVPPVPGGGALGGQMVPPGQGQSGGPFYGYPSLAAWQRATFGQQF